MIFNFPRRPSPLLEYARADANVRLDREQNVLRGVKILGLSSLNGRQYAPEALNRAQKLYENAKVNVNHPKESPQAPRDYQDRIGSIQNVRYREKDGLYGDFHFNPCHPLAEQLKWDAEHAPENVGFSHNIMARTVPQKDGTLLVEEITSVRSVDLVADPATTHGLFEGRNQVGDLQASDVQPRAIQEAELKALQEELAALRRQFQELLRTSQVVSEPVSRAPSDVLKERPMSTEDFVKTIRGN